MTWRDLWHLIVRREPVVMNGDVEQEREQLRKTAAAAHRAATAYRSAAQSQASELARLRAVADLARRGGL